MVAVGCTLNTRRRFRSPSDLGAPRKGDIYQETRLGFSWRQALLLGMAAPITMPTLACLGVGHSGLSPASILSLLLSHKATW